MSNQVLAVSRGGLLSGTAGWLLPTLLVLFFLSGASGLIYQVLWLRLLALVFGVTVWAASTVLASFMAGLALGSFAAGRLVDRARNPLRWFGVAEILVGLSALASPAVLEAVERLYVGLAPVFPNAPGPLALLRFLLSSAVLLVPTTLMGASLPIVVKSSLLRTEGLGQRISLLYATNTAGAILGTLLAGFVLIGGVGISISFFVAAAVNCLVGLVAVVASLVVKPAHGGAVGPAGPLEQTHAAAEAPVVLPARARRLVLLVFAVSGFATLALEVIWFRVLASYLQVTTYAFTVMLAAVLCGIAVGSYLVTPLMRRRLDWLLVLAAIELAIGVTALLSLAVVANAYDLLAWVASLLGWPAPAPGGLRVAPVMSFLALFPVTLLMGIAFPVGLRLWVAGDGQAGTRVGERVGLFYSLNVFGAILGSPAAGFLLLPWLGSRLSLIVVAALSLGLGLLLLTGAPRTGRALAVGGTGVLVFLAAALSLPDPFAAAMSVRYPGERLLWREEGVQATVSVHERSNGGRVLYLDGLHQAIDEEGTIWLHRMIGHLPMAIHPEPREVLVVGLGGGATAGAVSRHHRATIDVVELSGSVVRGAEWFRHVNHDVLSQPNVRLRVDDGRNYLLLTPTRYDVITADIILPFHAGAGNLYSAEYFRLAHEALKEDGLMLQWIGKFPESQHKLIMRTFLSVFPDATLWFDGALMVGTRRPLQLDPADFERKLQDPATHELLVSLGLDSFDALLAHYWAGPQEMRAYVGDGPILTDNRPMVEYFLSLPRGEPPADVSHVRGDPNRHVRR